MSNQIIKFEVGKTYYTRSLCDHDCIYVIKVEARTAKTVRVTERNETKTLRISEYRGVEQVKPHGSYSMAAIIGANDVCSIWSGPGKEYELADMARALGHAVVRA